MIQVVRVNCVITDEFGAWVIIWRFETDMQMRKDGNFFTFLHLCTPSGSQIQHRMHLLHSGNLSSLITHSVYFQLLSCVDEDKVIFVVSGIRRTIANCALVNNIDNNDDNICSPDCFYG